ncbi:Clustered mitochondria protein-like protein, partial [Bienertia sinuspersici]
MSVTHMKEEIENMMILVRKMLQEAPVILQTVNKDIMRMMTTHKYKMNKKLATCLNTKKKAVKVLLEVMKEKGPAKSNEAENTGKLRQGVDESSRDSSKNEENKKADDAPRDLEGALIPFIFYDLKLSCSNERWPCDLAACLSIQDLQKISGARILSEFPLFFLSYMLPAYMRALRVCILVD